MYSTKKQSLANPLVSISESKEQSSPLFTRKTFYDDGKEDDGELLDDIQPENNLKYNGLIKDFESLGKTGPGTPPFARLRKGSLPLPSLYSSKEMKRKSEEMGLSKRDCALQRRNARHFWGTMLIPGLDILKSDLIRVKEESDSRLLLFITDIKRSLREARSELEQHLLNELLEVATSFLSSEPNQIECGKYAEELLKKLNAKEMEKVEGLNREKVINLLFIISNFGRIKEFVSIESEKKKPENLNIKSSHFLDNEDEDFTDSSSDSSSDSEEDDDSADSDDDFPPYQGNGQSITDHSKYMLRDPRITGLKLANPTDPKSKRPLVRSKSFGPNKEKDTSKKEVAYKKLARSSSEIPTIKVMEIENQQQMVICRICENKISSSLLEEHSKICVMANQEDMRAMNVEDQLRAIAKIFLTRGTNLPADKKKQLSEVREIAQQAVEVGMRDCFRLIIQLKEKLKRFELSEENRVLANKIEVLISEKLSALKKAEEVINSSPRIFRTSPGRLSPRGDGHLEFPTIRGRNRSDSDPTQMAEYARPKGVPTIDDFQIIKPITKGGFGKVYLSKKKRTGDIYAIKRLKKSDMIKKNQVDHVKIERNILAHTSNPFVVKMYYSFQSKDYFYLVMEYVHGGDCFSLLQNLGALEEDMAKMIVAETVLALEYLHNNGIIHRDLKPDNLLIDKNGHVKLTDFGLSKVGLLDRSVVPPNYYSPNMSGQPSKAKAKKMLPLSLTKSMQSAFSTPSVTSYNSTLLDGGSAMDRTSPLFVPQVSSKQPIPITPISQQPDLSVPPKPARKLSCVGTPDYLAPEILLGIGHSKAVDWFAVGVILYEFLTGVPPFSADTIEGTFQNILQRTIKWPSDISEEAKDIIDKLLALNPQSRLGYNGAEEVKSHPFFQDINFNTIRTQKPFFVPVLEDLQDTSYFDARKQFYDLRTSDDSEGCSPYLGESDANRLFDDFLYVNFQSLSELNQNYLAETKPYVISRRRNSL
eukprot:gene8970-10521_t